MLMLILPVFALFLAIGVCINIGIVVETNKGIQDDGEAALKNQINRHVSAAIRGNVNWFSTLLTSYNYNVLGLLSVSAGDPYRADYNLNPIPSFFDWTDSYLKQPLVQDNRQTEPVSLGASNYYFPGSTPGSIPNFSVAQNTTRDLSSFMDYVASVLYEKYSDIFVVYFGTEDFGFFRNYPGRSTIDTDPGRTYDPRIRPWYTDAVAANGMIVTAPYQDFQSKKWMITFAIKVNDIDNNFLGVMGADVLLGNIESNIADISFLNTGKVTLFEESGIIVADKECSRDINNANDCTYNDLAQPPVPGNVWNSIIATSPGQTGTIETTIGGVEYLITASRLSTFQKYIIVVFIKKAEVTAPMINIINAIKEANFNILGSLGIGFGIGAVIMLVVVVFIAWRVTKPIDSINNSIFEIMTNVGRDGGLGSGVHEVHGGFGGEEVELARNVNDLIDGMRDGGDNHVVGEFDDVDLSKAPPAYDTIYAESNQGSSSSSSSSTSAAGVGSFERSYTYDYSISSSS